MKALAAECLHRRDSEKQLCLPYRGYTIHPVPNNGCILRPLLWGQGLSNHTAALWATIPGWECNCTSSWSSVRDMPVNPQPPRNSVRVSSKRTRLYREKEPKLLPVFCSILQNLAIQICCGDSTFPSFRPCFNIFFNFSFISFILTKYCCCDCENDRFIIHNLYLLAVLLI